MPANFKGLGSSVRQLLANSHVAVIAIIALLISSIDSTIRAFLEPLTRIVMFFITAAAILDIPYFSQVLTVSDRVMAIDALVYVVCALLSFSAAWLLSIWVYRVGPFEVLTGYYSKLQKGEKSLETT